MDGLERKRPPRQAAPGKQISISNSCLDYTLRAAAVHAVEHELAIVVAAADQQARGYRLSGKDHERLHQCHQFFIRILADLRGAEVLT